MPVPFPHQVRACPGVVRRPGKRENRGSPGPTAPLHNQNLGLDLGNLYFQASDCFLNSLKLKTQWARQTLSWGGLQIPVPRAQAPGKLRRILASGHGENRVCGEGGWRDLEGTCPNKKGHPLPIPLIFAVRTIGPAWLDHTQNSRKSGPFCELTQRLTLA